MCLVPQVSSVPEALDFAEKIGYPVIAKPVASSGSDGVAKCSDENELMLAVSKVCSGINTSGKANNTCLIQEFLEGTEFVVVGRRC